MKKVQVKMQILSENEQFPSIDLLIVNLQAGLKYKQSLLKSLTRQEKKELGRLGF